LAFLYLDGLQSQTVPKPLLSYLLPYSRTFSCTSKHAGWFAEGWIPTCYANKVLLKLARILIRMDASFAQTGQSRCYLPSSIFPNVQLH
jgi:hypothetical protein